MASKSITAKVKRVQSLIELWHDVADRTEIARKFYCRGHEQFKTPAGVSFHRLLRFTFDRVLGADHTLYVPDFGVWVGTCVLL